VHASPELLQQLTLDRQQDLRASATAHKLAANGRARRRIAQSLRRAADRLDAATSPTGVSKALPGGGC